MYNGKKKPFAPERRKYDHNNEAPDFDKYYEMEEEGLPLSEIANELNMNENFLDNMVKQMNKDK